MRTGILAKHCNGKDLVSLVLPNANFPACTSRLLSAILRVDTYQNAKEDATPARFPLLARHGDEDADSDKDQDALQRVQSQLDLAQPTEIELRVHRAGSRSMGMRDRVSIEQSGWRQLGWSGSEKGSRWCLRDLHATSEAGHCKYTR